MKSDYLNEQDQKYKYRNKICEFFQEEDLCPRRDQISLNLTVTSRDSHNYQAQSLTNNNTHIGNDLTLAMNELNKFNSWFNGLSTKNDKLIQDINQLVISVQKTNPVLLSMPDFGILRKKCHTKASSANNLHKGEENSKNTNNSNKICQQCKNRCQLIDFIKQQHQTKIEECNQLKKIILTLQKQIEQNNKFSLKDKLLEGVQYNLLQQQNQELKNTVNQLKIQIQRNRMEKSAALQKSASLLKTRDLERRLESVNNSSNNIKSFSNAKNSTNPTNPNDTMNRVDSIIGFQCEPNFDDLLRYFAEEAGNWKSKVIQLISQQTTNLGYKMGTQQKVKFLMDKSQKKIYECFKSINKLLLDIHNEKMKFTQYRSKRIQYLDSTTNKSQVKQLQKKIISLERQITNLEQTKNQTLFEYKQLQQRSYEESKKWNSTKRKLQSQLQKKMLQLKYMKEQLYYQGQARGKILNQLQDLKGGIRVYCRIRSRTSHQNNYPPALVANSKSVRIPSQNKQIEFDHVFLQHQTQQNVFEEVKPLVQCAYNGRDVCIFTYGQTGSGKTYTLHGTQKGPGLAPRVIQQLFKLVNKNKPFNETKIAMKAVQIYKQNILSVIPEKIGDKSGQSAQTIISDETYIYVNEEELLDLYNQGISKRKKCSTEMNANSSRSHFILNICIETRSCNQNKSKKSKISLIDLAGTDKCTSLNSEIIKQTQFINKSLSNLIGFISALKNKQNHIPYKDSKLTSILKDLLNTNSKILMFINVSPCQIHIQESINSLLVGQKVRGIQRGSERIQRNQKINPVIKKKQLCQNKQNSNPKSTVTRRSSSRLSNF